MKKVIDNKLKQRIHEASSICLRNQWCGVVLAPDGEVFQVVLWGDDEVLNWPEKYKGEDGYRFFVVCSDGHIEEVA